LTKIGIIGSGFSGLSAACYCAQQGHDVTIFEKNSTIGGRARSYEADGFMFDMGPSWYWMPDVFEKFFADFGKKPSDYYQLKQLSPSFQLFFQDHKAFEVPASLNDLYTLFESIETGSAAQLKKFMAEGELKYKVAMDKLIYRPSLSWMEFMSYEVISSALKTNIFSSMKSYIRKFFKDERLISLMEFPVIFLGAMPDRIPALYSLMNYAAFDMGTWYPMGGMCKITQGMASLALELGVKIETNTAVQQVQTNNGSVTALQTSKGIHACDAVIASADYQHVDQHLLPSAQSNYKADYWDKKLMAPSSLIFYLGVNKKIKHLLHHNLFFDTDFQKHAAQIYEQPQWPDDPLFYACVPSKTDATVAPEGMENVFILIPLATGLRDDKALHEKYYNKVLARMETICGEEIRPNVIYKRSYCVDDFKMDYNAYKGNAYGLANTLDQTAVFKPSIKNKNISNLYYTGQLTVPGPGVPPAIISGKIAASVLEKDLNDKRN
jgi:phytoene desaturase